jgi:hypothetical protein
LYQQVQLKEAAFRRRRRRLLAGLAMTVVAAGSLMATTVGTSAPTDPQGSTPATLLACDVLLAAQMEVTDEDTDTEESAPTLSVVRTEEE